MSAGSSTFSESWYRVANQRICLRPDVRTRRQNFRGERWIVVENPFSNQFFRVRPETYEFIARLAPNRTVEEVWRECLSLFPDSAPGQESVIQLLSQFYLANLLQYESAADAVQLFERYRKRRSKEIGSRFRNVMFMRFPLLDPDRFLVRTMPLFGKLISWPGLFLWLVVVGFGLKAVMENAGGLWDETQAVLSPSNIPLLYLTLFAVKAIHEFGHAFFCRKWGGEVHVMGMMLMIFTPVPYVDASSSWSFRSKRKRALVGAAGMIVELFVAAIAALVWARTGPGALHSIAHNIMFVASVSTLIFNLNPLLRFDGYYILSDVLDVPNLHQRATKMLRYLTEGLLFGVKKTENPSLTKAGGWGYGLFGVGSGIYRVIVFAGILLAIADQFLIIGIIMAVICLISWVTIPAISLVRYLASSPRLDRVRLRAILITCAALALLLGVLQGIHFPKRFRAPGVVRASERTELINSTAGEVESLLAQPGSRVAAGTPLMRLKNHELSNSLEQAQARAAEIESRLLRAMHEDAVDLKPLLESKAASETRLNKLRADVENLTLRARHDGVWVAPGIDEYVGRWIQRGSPLGLLINPSAFEFVATVPQEDADQIFKRQAPAEVRLANAAGTILHVAKWSVIPGEQRVLPSPALGLRGGGDVPVEMNDERGSKTAEPYFKVVGTLAMDSGAPLFDGTSGKMRFELGSEPLLSGWLRRLWQLLQTRYQL